MVDIKTQKLTIFVFILPLSICHSLKRAKKNLLLLFIFFMITLLFYLFLT